MISWVFVSKVNAVEEQIAIGIATSQRATGNRSYCLVRSTSIATDFVQHLDSKKLYY